MIVKEVLIYNLVEGIFFAKLICIKDGKEVEIDARTSDAIALAVRFNCPVFTFEFILSSAGIILDEESDSLEFETDNTSGESQVEMSNDNANDLTKKSVADLDKILNEALQKEDYERASIIRDEMNKRQSN